MMSNLLSGQCAVIITSDASGSWGCGAYLSTWAWFQLEWPKSWASTHITVKELLPLVLAIAMWGRQWHCDNAAVVAMLRSGWCKNEHTMHLLRSLFFFQASCHVSLVAEHIRGVKNGLADALSRNNHQKFLSCMSSACQVTEVRSTAPINASIGAPAARLDIQTLDRLATSYFTKGLADYTQRSYGSAQNRFLKFCTEVGLQPVPALEQVLCYFVAYLASSKLKHRTIKAYLSAVRYLHIAEGVNDSFTPSPVCSPRDQEK